MMDKIKGLLKGHEDQAGKGIDYVDQRTQGKYSGQVDTAQQRMKDELDAMERGQDEPPR